MFKDSLGKLTRGENLSDAEVTEFIENMRDDSDIVTVHTPLTTETKGMIGAAELARLKAGSVVANIARGGIIDETALLAALGGGHLAGAVLDVYASEPLAKDHPLRAASNVVLTPHIGASTAEAQRNVSVDVCRGVRDALTTGELSRSINVAYTAPTRGCSTSTLARPLRPRPITRTRSLRSNRPLAAGVFMHAPR